MKETLSKKQIVRLAADAADVSHVKAAEVYDTIFDAVKEAVAEGDTVNIIGFGKFFPKKMAEKKGRNPATGDEMMIPASVVPKFKFSPNFKEEVKENLHPDDF